MMYECLTGEVPFRANNYLGIISQVLTHTAAPPSQVRPELGIPDAVEAVVMRAMEKDRARRYAAMADLEHDLERLLAGDQNVGSPLVPEGNATAGRRMVAQPHRWHLGLVAALALGVGVSLALSRPSGGDMKQPPAKISTATVTAPAMPAPAAPRSVEASTPAGHVATDRPPRPASPHARARVERRAPAPAPAKAQGATSDSVKRGVLPSGSREAYPE
jgi:hypothetical protein